MSPFRSPAAPTALVAALAGAGCCANGAPAEPGLNRDTPADAFLHLRSAFAREDTGAQLRSMHPDFLERNGITSFKYEMAWALAPGDFRAVAAILAAARVASVEYLPRAVATRRGPRRVARVVLESGDGGRGVFLLADEPGFAVRTADEEIPRDAGLLPGFDGMARIEGGALVVEARIPLGEDAPPDGTEVRRVELHRDWLLFDIESLSGFDALLERVRATAGDAGREAGGGGGGER